MQVEDRPTANEFVMFFSGGQGLKKPWNLHLNSNKVTMTATETVAMVRVQLSSEGEIISCLRVSFSVHLWHFIPVN